MVAVPDKIPPRDLRPLLIGAVLLAVSLAGTGLLKRPAENPAAGGSPAARGEELAAAHAPLPEEVRGIYLTASTAGAKTRWNEILASAKGRGINSLVVDLKNGDGSPAFAPQDQALKDEAPSGAAIPDLGKLIEDAHADGFYLIARIPFFQDPAYVAKHPEVGLKRADGKLWKDKNGLYWADPAAEKIWKYNAALAAEAYGLGFDEIQFDYIRFATDGNTKAIVFPFYDAKKEKYRGTIGRLFDYLDRELRAKGIPISVDLFGLVTWHQSDLGIGQWYGDAIAHFDFVSPMVYPSHYASGTLGFKNPAARPYEIVADSMRKGKEAVDAARAEYPESKLASQRPWLQAFSMGAEYVPAMVMAQVRASRENGCSGFLFWNAANNYSSLPDLSGS